MTKIEEKIKKPHAFHSALFWLPQFEKWLPIPEYKNYEVSNYGRVRSIPHEADMIASKRRVKTKRKIKGCVRKQVIDIGGYCVVSLSDKNKKLKSKKVHLFVAALFVPNLGNKPQVNHIDGIKANNHYLNLEWATSSENMKHAFDNGLLNVAKGEDNIYSKVSNAEALDIFNSTLPAKDIAIQYAISIRTVYAIKEGQNYRSITGKKYERGRGALKGEECKNSKLNNAKAIEIYNSKLSYSKLSKIYGVTIGAIQGVKNGRTWSRVTQQKVK